MPRITVWGMFSLSAFYDVLFLSPSHKHWLLSRASYSHLLGNLVLFQALHANSSQTGNWYFKPNLSS
jgi:hypothetical protein